MKLFASFLAAITLACALYALAAPSFAQPTATNVAPQTQQQPQIKGDAPSAVDDQKRPPVVKCTWNCGAPQPSGVVESVGTKYTMFHQDGTPTRATANASPTQADTVKTKGSTSTSTSTTSDSHH